MKLQQQELIHPPKEPITKLRLKSAPKDPVQDVRDYFYIPLPLHEAICFPE